MIFRDQIRVEPAYREVLRAAGLERVDTILSCTLGKIVAWSRTTDSLYIADEARGVGLYVKRYFYPTWRHRLRGMFRGTCFGRHRGRAEAKALNAMRGLGLPVVRPIAYGCRRWGPFLTACFLITEEVPDAPNLTTFAQQVQSGARPLSVAPRRALTVGLAALVHELHHAGYAQGRLFWRNVLVRVGPTGAPEFYLLDPEPPKRLERLGRGGRWWLWELAKLAASAQPFTTRTERLRFVRRYFGIKKLTADAKGQVHEIERLARGWRRHEQQRIRMNARFEAWNHLLARELAADGGTA